ncbi:MAG: hypothetical protein KF789_13690 [Bdellovibrionaceae bacterium]|nr:hypothetical protein [Pseudobdellovibrionaceae bacterium]
MTERPAFILRLIEEHRAFSSAFSDLFSAIKDQGQTHLLHGLFVLCDDFLIRFHQMKEETLLHPLVRPDPRLRAGGPECSLHFDFFMTDRPLERGRRLLASEKIPETSPLMLSADEQSDQASASPLCIPGEDHQAGRLLMTALRKQPEPSTEADLQRQLRLFQAFFRIQSDHHRREEGCFFRLCEELIPPLAWNQIAMLEKPWAPSPSAGTTQALEALTKAGWSNERKN